ncbi:Ca2+-binding RTX toxin-like protein [Palleronia aestuarii]|uniref:Ca2+-binding RTX toxin-like protein n=1 Tax=Palleronia aestuarii TaxID=568105 RepID=A0A2W7NYK0_9RHOB|nr:calcium-binding protein [Palleronia aestuarii]PZX18366.1 Ca2+-binding RTX toxin-like protein [Palleronia aestuarii]
MAHLGTNYESFETLLEDDGGDWTVDAVYSADFTALNDSGVEGSAILALTTEADGSRRLAVSIFADGLAPNRVHVQHIHGTFDGQGNPTDATTPLPSADTDGDGFVELAEGARSYGGILLPLTFPAGAMPTANLNGTVEFVQNYDISEDLDDLTPLEFREVVLHGLFVGGNAGAGTGGEVNGQTGYKPTLPVAAGEIVEIDVDEALDLLEDHEDGASQRFIFGDGRQVFFAALGDDYVFGGDGDDRLNGGPGEDTVYGGNGDDYVGGGIGDDTVGGGNGNDGVGGGTGDDFLRGGNGNDRLFGSFGEDTMNGEAGADTLFGGAAEDILYGDYGNDLLRNGTGDAADPDNDANNGASGSLPLDEYDNAYAGGWGNDTIFGGPGSDIITGDDDSRVTAEVGSNFNAQADGSDVIYGGDGNDEIHTGSWADSDQGFANQHTGTSDDEAYGGAGNDIIRGAGGDDALYGDAGSDDIAGAAGDDSVFGGSGADVLYGNGGNDRMGGGGGADEVFGNAGRDTIYGGSGNDTIGGGTGNDQLYGSGGNDTIYGGGGGDNLFGGAGDDFLFGGAGSDFFFHTGAASDGTDIIADYDPNGTNELLFLSGRAIAQDDFTVNFVSQRGDASIRDALVTYNETGVVVWNVVDAEANDNLLVFGSGNGQIVDLFDV